MIVITRMSSHFYLSRIHFLVDKGVEIPEHLAVAFFPIPEYAG